MAATTHPQTTKGRATRERLLDCARREAIATGGRLEIAAVAERAGVVPSLVHRYFGSKAGLVKALIDDFFDRLHAEVLDVDPDPEADWPTRELLRLRRGVAFHYADPFAVVLYGQLARDPEVAQAERTRIDSVISQAAANVRRGQRRGELPGTVDPELAGAAMFGGMQRVMVVALSRTPHPSQRKLVEVLWRQVAAAVDIDPGSVHKR
jgi:AcrR family transcriptional regulator